MVENQENIEIKTESLESDNPAGNLKDPDETPSEGNPIENPIENNSNSNVEVENKEDHRKNSRASYSNDFKAQAVTEFERKKSEDPTLTYQEFADKLNIGKSRLVTWCTKDREKIFGQSRAGKISEIVDTEVESFQESEGNDLDANSRQRYTYNQKSEIVNSWLKAKETDSKSHMSDFAMQYGVDKSMLSKWVRKIGKNPENGVQKEEFQNDVKIKQELPDSEIEPLGKFEQSKITRNLPRCNYKEDDFAGSYSILETCETKLEEPDNGYEPFPSVHMGKQPYFCDNSLFQSASEDGFLNSLDELTFMGTNFFICCLHLFLKPENQFSREMTGLEETWNLIEEKDTFNISKSTVFDMINTWIANPKSDENQDYWEDAGADNLFHDVVEHIPIKSDFVKRKIKSEKKPKAEKNQPKEKKSLKCSLCDIEFSKKIEMSRHNVSVHDEKNPYLCFICGAGFLTNNRLTKHIKALHDGEKPYKCNICENRYSEKDTLKKHVANVHERKNYVLCNICGVSIDKYNLKQHIATVHEGKKPFQCNMCDKGFGQKVSLKTHIASIHEKQKPFQCEKCTACYPVKQQLTQHISTVHEGKKFHCSICDATYVNKAFLRRHIARDHEGKKILIKAKMKCHTCNNSFDGYKPLLAHINAVHDGKKPFKCSLCDAEFVQKSVFNRHMKEVHERQRPHKCDLCDASFFSKSGVTKHKESVHQGKKPHMCNLCGSSFSEKGNLNQHVAQVHEGKKRIHVNKRFKL
jgi:transposase-like protein